LFSHRFVGFVASLLPAAVVAVALFVGQPAWAQECQDAPQEVQVEQFSATIANTSGLGVTLRVAPGPQASRVGVLREGATVHLTGNEQMVAERLWREVESEDARVKGWVQDSFLQAAPPS